MSSFPHHEAQAGQETHWDPHRSINSFTTSVHTSLSPWKIISFPCIQWGDKCSLKKGPATHKHTLKIPRNIPQKHTHTHPTSSLHSHKGKYNFPICVCVCVVRHTLYNKTNVCQILHIQVLYIIDKTVYFELYIQSVSAHFILPPPPNMVKISYPQPQSNESFRNGRGASLFFPLSTPHLPRGWGWASVCWESSHLFLWALQNTIGEGEKDLISIRPEAIIWGHPLNHKGGAGGEKKLLLSFYPAIFALRLRGSILPSNPAVTVMV